MEDWDAWWFPFKTDADNLGWAHLVTATASQRAPIVLSDLGSLQQQQRKENKRLHVIVQANIVAGA